MNRYALVIAMLLAVAACYSETVGVPQREFRGKNYLFEPYSYYGPIWYAGNGVIVSPESSWRSSKRKGNWRASAGALPPPCSY